MAALSRTDLDALLADAEAAFEQYLKLAEKAVQSGSSWSKRRAAVEAVNAMRFIPALTEALARKAVEADTAHDHFVQTARSDWRHRAGESALRTENVRLLAEVDQLRAASRDCSCGGAA